MLTAERTPTKARTMKAKNTLEVDEVITGPTIGTDGKKAPLRPAPATSQEENWLDGQKTSRALSMTLHYRKAVSHRRERLKKSQDMIGEKYTTTGSYIRTAILTLNVPSPARPIAPVATGTPPAIDAVDQEIFKEKIRMYVKVEASIETTMKSLYDLLWGQCRETICSRLRGYDDYADYSANAGSMVLLKAIRAEMTGFRDKQYLPHSLH
jgi:hypothetical protein